MLENVSAPPRTLITFLLLLKLCTEGIGVLPRGGEKCAQPHDQPIGLLGCIVRQQPSYPLGEELRRRTLLAWPELAGPVLSDEISIGHIQPPPQLQKLTPTSETPGVTGAIRKTPTSET